MAIARDTYKAMYNPGTAASHTFSYTVSGSDRLLLVCFTVVNSTNRASGVTYNGTAMTSVLAASNQDSRWQHLYYLINPDTGTHNVVITLTGSYNTIYVGAISYTGVAQTGFPDASSGSLVTVGSGDSTKSLTTVGNNACIVLYYYGYHQGSTNTTDVSYLGGVGLSEYTGLDAGAAGSKSMSVSPLAAYYSAYMQMVSFLPAAAAASGPAHLKKYNGIATANIKKINGIAIANIKKINGIA